MKPRLIVTILCVMLTASLLGLITISESVSALQVPSDYTTIQAAINHANPNDTILVAPGNYPENVVINQTVTLRGSGEDVTFITAASGAKAAIEIQASSVNLTGFTIQGGSIGIHLNLSHNDIIANNTVLLNTNEGIFLQNSTHNLIYNNIVAKNVYTGIDLLYADQNRISNNTISFHPNVASHDQGVLMDSSQNNTVDRNILLNNAYSIEMIGAANNTFYSNIVSFGYHGVELDVSDDNTFYHNNFLNNTLQVSSYMSVNTWDDRSLLEGNYWSDFREKYPDATEVDSSGVWDTPYVFDVADANNNDTYPLVNPWSPPVPDVTPPVTTDDYDGLWHSHDFIITLAAGDFSGVNETYYRINDAPAVSNVTANGQPLITTESANNTLEYWSVDNVGNEEPHKILTGIMLDKTPPSLTVESPVQDSEVKSSQVTVEWFGIDIGVGIDHYEVNLDNGSWTDVGPVRNHTFAGLNDGTHTVYIKGFDKLGHESEVSVSFLVNTTPIGGPGYFDEAVVVVIVVVVIAVALSLFWFRKKRMKKPESNLSRKTQS